MAEVADALGISERTVERPKRRFVEDGLEASFGLGRRTACCKIRFDGRFEVRLIPLICSPPKAPHDCHTQIPQHPRTRGEIAAMLQFTKNNGITEGFHRKMKLIQRRAYGFRNFENYRLRVIAACG